MYLSVDEDTTIEGFTFKNKDNVDEKVELNGSTVSVYDAEECESIFYYEDIPKLIKALQAAYDHHNKSSQK